MKLYSHEKWGLSGTFGVCLYYSLNQMRLWLTHSPMDRPRGLIRNYYVASNPDFVFLYYERQVVGLRNYPLFFGASGLRPTGRLVICLSSLYMELKPFSQVTSVTIHPDSL